MCNLINVCLYIGNFNTGTPNYHHCLLSSNLGTILLGRKECDIMYAYILDNFNSNFNFQMFPYINFNIKVVSDHYTDHHLFDHCADHHMSDHYANIKQLFLFVIQKDAGYQKKH